MALVCLGSHTNILFRCLIFGGRVLPTHRLPRSLSTMQVWGCTAVGSTSLPPPAQLPAFFPTLSVLPAHPFPLLSFISGQVQCSCQLFQESLLVQTLRFLSTSTLYKPLLPNLIKFSSTQRCWIRLCMLNACRCKQTLDDFWIRNCMSDLPNQLAYLAFSWYRFTCCDQCYVIY